MSMLINRLNPCDILLFWAVYILIADRAENMRSTLCRTKCAITMDMLTLEYDLEHDASKQKPSMSWIAEFVGDAITALREDNSDAVTGILIRFCEVMNGHVDYIQEVMETLYDTFRFHCEIINFLCCGFLESPDCLVASCGIIYMFSHMDDEHVREFTEAPTLQIVIRLLENPRETIFHASFDESVPAKRKKDQTEKQTDHITNCLLATLYNISLTFDTNTTPMVVEVACMALERSSNVETAKYWAMLMYRVAVLWYNDIHDDLLVRILCDSLSVLEKYDTPDILRIMAIFAFKNVHLVFREVSVDKMCALVAACCRSSNGDMFELCLNMLYAFDFDVDDVHDWMNNVIGRCIDVLIKRVSLVSTTQGAKVAFARFCGSLRLDFSDHLTLLIEKVIELSDDEVFAVSSEATSALVRQIVYSDDTRLVLASAVPERMANHIHSTDDVISWIVAFGRLFEVGTRDEDLRARLIALITKCDVITVIQSQPSVESSTTLRLWNALIGDTLSA